MVAFTMLAARNIIPRATFRATQRVATPTFIRAFHPAIARRAEDEFSVPGVNHIPGSTTSPGSPAITPEPAKKIHVVSYTDGQRVTEQIDNKPAATGPVNPEGEDVEHKAQTLDAETLERLTPTMKKFTLTGKVAVVTG